MPSVSSENYNTTVVLRSQELLFRTGVVPLLIIHTLLNIHYSRIHITECICVMLYCRIYVRMYILMYRRYITLRAECVLL